MGHSQRAQRDVELIDEPRRLVRHSNVAMNLRGEAFDQARSEAALDGFPGDKSEVKYPHGDAQTAQRRRTR